MPQVRRHDEFPRDVSRPPCEAPDAGMRKSASNYRGARRLTDSRGSNDSTSTGRRPYWPACRDNRTSLPARSEAG